MTSWLALAVLVAGCDDSNGGDPNDFCGDGHIDINEECDNDSSTCRDCSIVSADMTAHWSFETLDGDTKSPCLPGNPEVRIDVFTLLTGTWTFTAPCESGQSPVRVKQTGLWGLHVASTTDRVYGGGLLVHREDLPSPDDFPTAIIYTDAGYLTVSWSTPDGRSCVDASISDIRVTVDGAVLQEAPCNSFTTTVGPILEGTRSLQVEGIGWYSGTVVATSDPVDVTVVAGMTPVAATVSLRFN